MPELKENKVDVVIAQSNLKQCADFILNALPNNENVEALKASMKHTLEMLALEMIACGCTPYFAEPQHDQPLDAA